MILKKRMTKKVTTKKNMKIISHQKLLMRAKKLQGNSINHKVRDSIWNLIPYLRVKDRRWGQERRSRLLQMTRIKRRKNQQRMLRKELEKTRRNKMQRKYQIKQKMMLVYLAVKMIPKPMTLIMPMKSPKKILLC